MIRLRFAVLVAAVLAVWAGVSPASADNTTDGHSASGTSFSAEAAAATQLPSPQASPLPTPTPQASPPATPTPSQPRRIPAGLKLLIGVVAIIFGLTVARRASRRGNAERAD